MVSWSVDCVLCSSGISRHDPKCDLCGSGTVSEKVAGDSLISTE